MTDAILGIDISKRFFDVYLIHANKSIAKHFSNDTNGFAALDCWLNKNKVNNLHACLEATGIYGEALALHLYQRGINVSVVNPFQIKRFAQSKLVRIKTDKTDAHCIAEFCHLMKPSLWKPLPDSIKTLKAFVAQRDHLIKIEKMELNRLEDTKPEIKSCIEQHIAFIKDQLCQIEQRIKDHIALHNKLKESSDLLNSIPAVGSKTTSQILTFLYDVRQFKSAKQVVTFLGLNPSQKISGSSVRGKTRISKVGDSQLRRAFYMPAVVAMQHNPAVKALADRLKAAGKHPMVIVIAAMRKLIHIIYGVLKSEKPFDVTICLGDKKM